MRRIQPFKRHWTMRDRSGSTKPALPRATRGATFLADEPVALNYESADVLFNVSSCTNGVLLLQAGARKIDGGFAGAKCGAARRQARGCIMRAAPHNYRVAGKLYDPALGARVLIFSLPCARVRARRPGQEWKITRRNGAYFETGRESERYPYTRRKGRQVAPRMSRRAVPRCAISARAILSLAIYPRGLSDPVLARSSRHRTLPLLPFHLLSSPSFRGCPPCTAPALSDLRMNYHR